MSSTVAGDVTMVLEAHGGVATAEEVFFKFTHYILVENVRGESVYEFEVWALQDLPWG